MKAILILCATILVAVIAVVAWKFARNEDHFGKPFSAGLPAATIPELVAKPADYLGKPVSITGKLLRQCPATGCWFYLADPADPKAQQLMVETGDTTPHLPQSVGKIATVEGQLIKHGEGYQFIGVAVTFHKEARP